MVKVFFAVVAAFGLVACGGGDFTGSPGAAGASDVAGHASVAGSASASGGAPAVAGATGDAGEPSDPGGAGGVPELGGAGEGGASGTAGAPAGGAAGSGGAAPGCTSFDASKPALPARCAKVQSKSCDPGDTCVTLEQKYSPAQQAPYDLCMPTQIQTTCAACRETMTCACLAADFTFDKTGLENWQCCDTSAGPVYELKDGYGCPPK